MAGPLVSVVLPLFNAEQFIDEALDSIWDQDYEPLEVVVVDDASTDGSVGRTTRLHGHHPELRLLEQPQNLGPAAARNVGLAATRGELITFLDADDLMTPQRMRFQVAFLAAHPDVDVVVGTGRIEICPGVETVPPLLRHRRLDRPRFHQMSMMVRRTIIEHVGPFDESFRVGEDTEWMYRARMAGVRTRLVDRDLLVRRIHGANLIYETGKVRRAMQRAILKTARGRVRDRSDAR